MILPDLARSISQRVRRLSTWGAMAGFGLVWILVRLLAGVTFERLGVWEFFIPPLFLLGHLALSAAPWQWTGDSRSSAPLWRGCIQALLWNGAWVFLILWGAYDLVKPARPARQPEPPAQEQREAPPRDREAPPTPEARPAPREDRSNPRAPGLRPELMLLLINLPFALVLGWFLAEKERIELAERELQARERQARARALQSQLHPHVLFNVLGGLTELVHEDPDAAEEALVGLTDLLRMLMRHGSALSLPLGQERTLLRRYLEIESIRLGSRLKVEWTWQEELNEVQVPPLLLQPLVENAVKHGISAHPDGGVLRIEAIRTERGMLLRVANSGRPLDGKTREGTGLGNLRERLALLPAPRPAFDLRQEGVWTVAELRLEGLGII